MVILFGSSGIILICLRNHDHAKAKTCGCGGCHLSYAQSRERSPEDLPQRRSPEFYQHGQSLAYPTGLLASTKPLLRKNSNRFARASGVANRMATQHGSKKPPTNTTYSQRSDLSDGQKRSKNRSNYPVPFSLPNDGICCLLNVKKH